MQRRTICFVVLCVAFLIAVNAKPRPDRVRRDGGRLKGREGRRLGYSQTHPRQYSDICGKQKKQFTRFLRPTFKIFNGTCAKYGELPWVAQIQVRDTANARHGVYDHYCGATILSDNLVLTAAHCFQAFAPSMMRVVVGQSNLNAIDPEEQAFDVEEVIKHRRWDSPRDGLFSNDIALVKLRRKGDGSGIRFSDNVAPACLPDPDDENTVFRPGMHCVIAGWGRTENKDSIEECMQAAMVPIISDEECKDMYSNNGRRRIARGMTCAGYRDGGVDTCKGDSGGPLACRAERDGQFYVHGIVSWGDGCGAANKPGVYTMVRHYLDWIEEMIEKLA